MNVRDAQPENPMTPTPSAREELLTVLSRLPRELDASSDQPLETIAAVRDEVRIALRMTLHNRTFTIVHDKDPTLEARAVLECHCGRIDGPDRAQVMAHLLTMNHQVSPMCVSQFAIDADTSDVIHTVSFPIHGLTPATLARQIVLTFDAVDAWCRPSQAGATAGAHALPGRMPSPFELA